MTFLDESILYFLMTMVFLFVAVAVLGCGPLNDTRDATIALESKLDTQTALSQKMLDDLNYMVSMIKPILDQAHSKSKFSCDVEVMPPALAFGPECPPGDVMTGTQGDELYCSQITVTCE